ncbi:MAG TPA: iron ABC transporter permease [Stellaceae bacterium]|jgi:iron(III) transport system permease protein
MTDQIGRAGPGGTLAVESGTLLAMRLHWAARRSGLLPYLIFALVFVLVATPVVFLLLGSVSAAALPGDFSLLDLTLRNYAQTWLDPSTYALFGNTAIYVLGSTALGITVATMLAWLVERTDMRGKAWVYACVPMTLAVPGMLQSMAWVLMLSPRVGFINKLLMNAFGLSTMPLNIYSFGGLIFVEGLRLVPTAFLMLVPLLRGMDPGLEEAAAAAGAGPLRVLHRVSLKLMAPGLLAIVIYQAMTALEIFEVPGLLGQPAGIFVFSTRIYAIIASVTITPDYGDANALAVLYLIVAVLATFLYARVIARSERYAVISGKGYRPQLQRLGKWRAAASLLAVAYLTLSVILPFIVLVYTSFLSFIQEPSAKAFASMTFKNYAQVFHTPSIGLAVQNTAVMVAVTATATTLLSFVISLIVVRSRFWGRRLLDQLAFFPTAIPGIVMAIAFIWIFLQFDRFGLPFFGTIWSVAVVFTVSFMAYGTRAMNAAILQIHKDLEEAAYVAGAAQWRIMWRIFVPLVLPSLAGVWIWTALHAINVAGMPLLLTQGPRNQVLSVMIWNMWDNGYLPLVGAVGTLLMIFLGFLALATRWIAFGRGPTAADTR